MLTTSPCSAGRQGYLCAHCKHSPVRAAYRVTGAILCVWRGVKVESESEPSFCRGFVYAPTEGAAFIAEGGAAC